MSYYQDSTKAGLSNSILDQGTLSQSGLWWHHNFSWKDNLHALKPVKLSLFLVQVLKNADIFLHNLQLQGNICDGFWL